MLSPTVLTAFGVATALGYVQFDNSIALHLKESAEVQSPWTSVYLEESTEFSDMNGVDLLQDGTSTWPQCNKVSATDASCKIEVLFAISQCLDTSTALAFKQWMEKIASSEEKFLTGGRPCDIEFSTAILNDCAGSKVSPTSNPDSKKYLSSSELEGISLLVNERWHDTELLTSELATNDLIDYFTPFGNVYCSLNATSSIRPDAVISLFGDAISHKAVVEFEHDRKIQTVFNFHVCQGLDTAHCRDRHLAFADDSVLLLEAKDLFMHNPFKAVQSFHCAQALPNGLPVVSLDKTNTRQCHCKCPSGYEDISRDGKRMCTPTPKKACQCYWSNRQYNYDIVSAADTKSSGANPTCSISKLYPSTITRIPYPRSNYVGGNRKNAGDSDDAKSVATGSPLIQVVVDKRTAEQVTPKNIIDKSYPWTYFELNRDSVVNSLNFDGPGIYSIKMKAKDYRSDADCDVCLSVVDRFRPVSTSRCPAPLCEQTPCVGDAVVEYTTKNIALAQAVYQQHIDYSKDSNVVNDACGEARCDDKHYYRKDMLSADYIEANINLGGTCFTDKIPATVDKKLQASPFGENGLNLQQALPVSSGQCTRCCKFTTQLKEWWHDYKCGNSSIPAAQCSGTDPGCKTTQCLVAQGTTLFSASASIQSTYKSATNDLIKRMYPTKGYDSASEIHLLLECTAFGVSNEGKCAHVASISQLFSVQSALNDNQILSGVDSKAYVSWRFRVDGGAWKLFSDDTPLRFDSEKSSIVVEAWSQCGLVKKAIFNVFLHLNRKICIAEEFDRMWYQTTSNYDGTGALCNYQESDFAELTFDYNPLDGLICGNQSDKSLRSLYISNGVTCTVQYATTQSSGVLVASSARNESLVRRFSFQMLAVPTTKADTTFTVACSFAYEGLHTPNVTIAVSKTFTIKNCDAPGWDCPFGECSDKCMAQNSGLYGSKKPAPFQACRGTTVYATAKQTVVGSINQTCCQNCGVAQCQSILDIPCSNDNQDVYRCVVVDTAPLTDKKLLSQGLPVSTEANVMTMACMLLAFGLVMVVVSQHMQAREETSDDYYPLLEQ